MDLGLIMGGIRIILTGIMKNHWQFAHYEHHLSGGLFRVHGAKKLEVDLFKKIIVFFVMCAKLNL